MSQKRTKNNTVDAATKDKLRKDYPFLPLQKYVSQVENSPYYKDGTDEYKNEVRSLMYEQKVKPYMLMHGVPPPSKEEFLQQGKPANTKDTLGQHTQYAAMSGVKEVIALDKGIKNIANFFNKGLAFGHKHADFDTKANDEASAVAEQYLGNAYDHSFRQKAFGFLGEGLPQLAAFEAVAPIASGAESAKILSAKPVLAYAQKKLLQATEGYLVDVVEGKGFDSKQGAATFVAGGVAGDVLRPIAKYFGKMIGIGGVGAVEKSIHDAADSFEKELPALQGGQKQLAGQIAQTQGPFTQPASSIPPPASLLGTGNTLQDKILRANREVLNQIAREDFKVNNFNLVPRDKKAQVVEKAGAIARGAAQRVSVTNPQVLKAQVTSKLEKATKQSPELGQWLGELEQASKTKTADVVMEHVKELATVKTSNPIGTIQEVENPNSSVGAAASRSPEFLRNVLDTVTQHTPYRFESSGQKLVFLWGIRKTLPKQVRDSLLDHLQDDASFRNKGYTSLDFTKMSQSLNEHLGKLKRLEKDPDVATHGADKVFRSTNLEGGMTTFQYELNKKIAIMELQEQLKRQPGRVKDAVQSALDSLTKLRAHDLKGGK